jgi:hypothetical protein
MTSDEYEDYITTIVAKIKAQAEIEGYEAAIRESLAAS